MDSKSNNRAFLITISILFSIMIILFIYLGIYFSNMTKAPFTCDITNNSILINGWGNANINLNNIESVSLIDAPLKVVSNNGGGAIGKKIYGDEKISTYGYAKCFVENLTHKSIFIKATDANYIINFNSTEQTVNKFNEIKQKLFTVKVI